MTWSGRPVLTGGLVAAAMAGALVPGVPPWAALLVGSILGFTVGRPAWLPVSRLTRWTLQAAVVGIGAGVDLSLVARVGADSIVYTMVGLGLTLAAALVLGKWMRVEPHVGAMIFAGTGICGGSAIAAVAPAIRAESNEVSAAMSTVFMLNAVALLIFPGLGHLFELGPKAYGLWCALAIHDTSSVVGAAVVGGREALLTATTVKLVRTLWIVPVALMLGYLFRKVRSPAGSPKIRIPWFIGGFVIVSAIFTFLPEWRGAVAPITHLSHALLTLTLLLIGLEMNWAVWRSVGLRALGFGLVLWLAVGSGTVAAIKLGWIW